MNKTTKPSETSSAKPADKKPPEAELNEKELEAVTGGRISNACVTGKHIAKGTIIT